MNVLKVLEEAELKDKFQERCKNNYVNNIVRKNFSYTTDYNSYYSTILDFMENYPIFKNVILVQLDKSAENGYPHTRPNNVICIPSNSRLPSLEKTMFHEVVHVHQRNNHKLWEGFLNSKEWYHELDEIVPERWREKCRINPDTCLKQFWSFQKRWIPLPLFTNDANPKFEDVKIMFYDLKTGILEHQGPSDFVSRYGSSSQPEHPYELYAVELAEKGILDEEMLKRYLTNYE
jgi:hypothetical protein